MKNKFRIILISALIIIETILLLLWHYEIWIDFTINLLTEVLGIAITIIVIDYLLQRDKKIRKKNINDLAFIMSRKTCNEILIRLIPRESKIRKNKITKSRFGDKDLITYNDFDFERYYNHNKEDIRLFVDRIKTEVSDPTFIDRTSTQKYIKEKNQIFSNLLFMIDTSLEAFQFYEDNEFYSTVLEMKFRIIEYQDLISIIGDYESIGKIISEYEIQLVNIALKLREMIRRKTDKIEILIDWNKI